MTVESSALRSPTPLDPTESQVAEYLRRNPDFLRRHPDLGLSLEAPQRWPDAGQTVDLQAFMNQRLRQELDRVRQGADDLIATARSNMSVQASTHRAVLSLVAARDITELTEAIGADLPVLLDIDVATLCFEADQPLPPALQGANILPLAVGSVVRAVGGAGHECALNHDIPGDPALFGSAAPLVQSSAVVRLCPPGLCPPGLLALGARHHQTFHPGQGTELLTFLARVLDLCLARLVG